MANMSVQVLGVDPPNRESSFINVSASQDLLRTSSRRLSYGRPEHLPARATTITRGAA